MKLLLAINKICKVQPYGNCYINDSCLSPYVMIVLQFLLYILNIFILYVHVFYLHACVCVRY